MEIVQKLRVLDSLSLMLLILTLHSLSRSYTHTHTGRKEASASYTTILCCCELLINFLVGRPGNVNKISVLSEPHFYSHLFWEATFYSELAFSVIEYLEVLIIMFERKLTFLHLSVTNKPGTTFNILTPNYDFLFFFSKTSFIILSPVNLCTVKSPYVSNTRPHTCPAKYLTC